MKPSDLLKKYGWTQGAYARNARGEPIAFDDENATCFCVLGAIKKSDAFFLLRKFQEKIGPSPVTWNDAPNRTKEEVIAVLEAVEKEMEIT